MKKIDEKISATIEKHSMIRKGDTVILAVSGGADSMCLLHFFNRFSSEMELNIICAHVNHGIRGDEAVRDEKFVENFCRMNSIQFKVESYNIPEIAAKTGESQELCGRRLRYEFFNSIFPGAKIATAHNLDDSMETFILNLARGTSLKGLVGIPPVRDNIIRPIIDCTRDEIEEYLNFHHVDFVTDSTNFGDAYTRNKIRHSVIPVLKSLNSNFPSVFKSCTDSLSALNNYMNSVTQEAFLDAKTGESFSVDFLLSLDEIVLTNVIAQICRYYGGRDISSLHISLIVCNLKGGAVMLPGGVTVASDGKMLFKAMKIKDTAVIYQPIDDMSVEYVFPACKIGFISVDKNDIKNYNIKTCSYDGYCDADKLKNAVFRTRKDGDRFSYPNSVHSKSLKNLFKEKSISPQERKGVPFIADENNVLWIDGVGVSKFACVDENTVNVVKINIKKGTFE